MGCTVLGHVDGEKHRAALARIAELEAALRHATKIETALRGIIGHWYEFAEMMIENKTDYGLGERIDAAAKLVK
jgi:hypothetical protein